MTLLKKDDQAQVIAGREKGKIGKILKVNAKSMRVTLEKINMVKRHMKASQANPQGGIIEKELPLHVSNILLFCAKCGRGTRHGSQLVDKAAKKAKGAQAAAQKMKVRTCKKCGTSPDSK